MCMDVSWVAHAAAPCPVLRSPHLSLCVPVTLTSLNPSNTLFSGSLVSSGRKDWKRRVWMAESAQGQLGESVHCTQQVHGEEEHTEVGTKWDGGA